MFMKANRKYFPHIQDGMAPKITEQNRKSAPKPGMLPSSQEYSRIKNYQQK